jgi:minimal PKS chain-length factor (CLF/KS beta)
MTSTVTRGKRPVITGLGVVAPSGIGTDEHWRSTLRGELMVETITSFDPTRYSTTLAGEVNGFRAADYLDNRVIVQTDRWTWLGMAATQLAMADAAYDPGDYDAEATSVVFASGSGGNYFGQQEIQRLWSKGRQAVSVYQSVAWFYAATTGQTSIRHGIKGPSGVIVSDAAGGLDSLAQARRIVRRGTPTVFAGGAEAGLTPYALTCQTSSGRLTHSRTPEAGYKPFDRRANGHVPGEGAATLIVEDPATAASRGAPQVYGEIAGYAATHDGVADPHSPPQARWLANAMRRALADADLAPADIDVIFADGAGSLDLDALEAEAVHEVFAQRPSRVPVTAPQGLIGRLCAGGSALSVVNALLAIRDGVIPAVGNLDDPVTEFGLDLVRLPRRVPVRVAMVNARGYGGFNSCMIVKAVDRA